MLDFFVRFGVKQRKVWLKIYYSNNLGTKIPDYFFEIEKNQQKLWLKFLFSYYLGTKIPDYFFEIEKNQQKLWLKFLFSYYLGTKVMDSFVGIEKKQLKLWLKFLFSNYLGTEKILRAIQEIGMTLFDHNRKEPCWNFFQQGSYKTHRLCIYCNYSPSIHSQNLTPSCAFSRLHS